MKRLLVTAMLVMAGLGTMAPSAHAFGVFGAWWDAEDASDGGLGFGIRSQTRIVPLVSIDTRISWIKFSDDDFSVYPIEVTGMLKLGMLYAGVGVGYYFFSDDLENDFGWYLVGGIDIGAGPVGIFGEVKWTSLSTDIKNAAPPESLSADGIGINVGVMFGVPGM